MTTSEKYRRAVGARRGRPSSLGELMADGLRDGLRELIDASEDEEWRRRVGEALNVGVLMRWPSLKYRDDPLGFARDVLGVDLTEEQQEILLAVRDRPRVAVSSGHKIGKTMVAAVAALWFYSTHDRARVVLMLPGARQVKGVLWREIGILYHNAKISLGGKFHKQPASGLTTGNDWDHREIVGYTVAAKEAAAGTSGWNIFYILDEASGIPDEIEAAIQGNLAGGAKQMMLSNPTRTVGFFFDAFHKDQLSPQNPDGVWCKTLSSECSPNVKAGRIVIKGMATKQWIDDRRRAWGEDSPLFLIRVKGQFALREQGHVVSLNTIALSQERWYRIEAQRAEHKRRNGVGGLPCEGLLTIGLDPAGFSGQGDETVYAVRRGLRVLELFPFTGLTESAHLTHLLTIIRERRVKNEVARVVVDINGDVGARVMRVFRDYIFDRGNAAEFDFVPMNASQAAYRNPDKFYRQRDALWANLAEWIRDVEHGGKGGAIPRDTMLQAELHAHQWVTATRPTASKHVDRVTPKPDIRKVLGRSPDRADAVCLALWDPMETDVLPEWEQHRLSHQRMLNTDTSDYYGSTGNIHGLNPVNPFPGRRRDSRL